MNGRIVIVSALAFVVSTSFVRAGTFEVTGLSPQRHALTASVDAMIEVTFSQPVNLGTVTNSSFRVFGRSSGVVNGMISSANGGQTIVFTSSRRFIAGDLVTVTMANTIQSAGGDSLRAAGYVYQFSTAAALARREFSQVQTWNVRTGLPGNARIYGGQAVDLNGNGFVDLGVICEDSSDVRVYLNSADGSGLFGPRLDPPPTVGSVPSPNEGADFNNDGFVDICTANFNSATVTVLLGNGDGTFGARQDIAVGGQARGLAAIDFDGDGDADIACAASASSHVAVSLNNGAGVFGPAMTFDAGGNGEYGLAGADMDNDGIIDLVVGHRASQNVTVLRGNGNGTFTFQSSQNSGGATWVVYAGDLNGDGWMDVTTANSFSQNGAVLLNNGAGAFNAPVVMSLGAHTVSTDLGDLDGDGDLDWILSSYGGGFWRLFENDGAGGFSQIQDITADSNPACAAAADVNNDGAIDLVLFDEIADTVRIQLNTAVARGDMNCDGVVDGADIGAFVLAVLDSAAYETQYEDCLKQAGDVNLDSSVDAADVVPFALLLLTH